MKVEIYSDIACPWCYVGGRRFARALSMLPPTVEVEVVFRPFQLDPTLPHTPSPLIDQLGQKFGARAEAMIRHVTSVAANEGLELRFDRAQAVNTLNAHRLLRLAERGYGAAVQREVADKLFESPFTSGENVADVEVLTRLAASAGMSEERVREHLNSDEGVQEVRRDMSRARSIGVQAVPTFVFDGKRAIQGAQPASVFLQQLEELLPSTDAALQDSEAAVCVDGSCEA